MRKGALATGQKRPWKLENQKNSTFIRGKEVAIANSLTGRGKGYLQEEQVGCERRREG